MKSINLKKGFVISIGIGALILGYTLYEGVTAYGGSRMVTGPIGVSVVPLAPVGHFEEIGAKAKYGDWQAQIKTNGQSDLHVVEVTIQPGGTLGWHSHIGPSFVIVKSGTATFYEGDDPNCTPNLIPTGATLFEAGGDIHIVRNEGTVPLVNVVVQLIPNGTPRLTSEPSPGNCSF